MNVEARLFIKSFSTLTNEELYTILRIRQAVFIVEQNCPYLDADDKDLLSHHLWLNKDEQLVAYCRVLPPDIAYEGYTSIGRVMSHRSYRRTNLGRQIMTSAIDFAKATWPRNPIKISAQCYLEAFYASFGFWSQGTVYLEDDIPHIAMVLE